MIVDSKIMILYVILMHFHLTILATRQFNIIGLFTISNCTEGEEYLCQNAKINALGMQRQIFTRRKYYKLGYCFIDSRNSEHFLTETVLKIVERREVKENDACFSRSDGFVVTKNSLFFLTLMSYELTRLVSFLLYSVFRKKVYSKK